MEWWVWLTRFVFLTPVTPKAARYVWTRDGEIAGSNVARLQNTKTRVGVLLASVLALATAATAQTSIAPSLDFLNALGGSSEPTETAIAPVEPSNAVKAYPQTVDKRLFGVIPNYRADQAQAVYQPISTREKFQIARSDSFDWPNYFLLVGYTLQSQMAAGASKNHDGIQEFGEFYSRGLADQVIGNYISEAILPSLLHEDPRFFRRGSGSFWSRTGYAVSRTFVAQLDNGGKRFNVSELVGNVGVVAITTLYYPESQSASGAAQRYAMMLGNDTISNLLTEFWPDIKHRLPYFRHRS